MNTIASKIRWVLQGQDSASATLQTLLSKAFILAINVATGIITARFLGADGRGEQAAIVLWPQFLAYLMTLGIPSSLIYNLKRHRDRESEIFSAALILSIGLGLLTIGVGVAFIPQWMTQYSASTVQTAQWFMLAAPLSLLSITFSSALQAKDDFTTPNQALYGSPLLTLAGLIGLVATGKLTPLTAGLAYALPSIPSTLWLMLRLQTLFQIQWNHFLVSAKLLLDYGLRSYGVDILGTLSLQIGQVLVVGLLSPANMGLYTVALSLSRMLNLVQSSIVTVLLPKAANRPIAEICTLTSRVARISLAFTLGIAAIVAGIAPTLLHWLYGAEFLQAVTVLQILLLEVVLGSTVWILAQAFMAAGRPGIVTLLQGIGLGLTLPLMLMLIPRYGLVGAGLSLLGSTIIRLGFILVCFLWVLKVPIPSLLLAGEDITFLQKRLLKQR